MPSHLDPSKLVLTLGLAVPITAECWNAFAQGRQFEKPDFGNLQKITIHKL